MEVPLPYPRPQDVHSPRSRWSLIHVLADEGEGEHSVAVGLWDHSPVLAMRWNGGGKDGPLGNPQSRGLPIWFIVPKKFNSAVLSELSAEKRTLAQAVLGS
jgi:hypothetical protein